MKTSNRIALAAVAIGIAGVVAWALRPVPVLVETSRAVRGPYEQIVSDDGKTRVRDRYTITAPLAGRIERIRLRAGDVVTRGEEVAVLTPALPALHDARTERELRARLGAVEAQHQRAAAEVKRVTVRRDQARVDLARQKKLQGEGFISPAALEQASLALQIEDRALEAAQFAEESGRHELEQARVALGMYRGSEAGTAWAVRSPVSGRVLRIVQESEAVVAVGAPLLDVADPRNMEAVVDIASQDSVAIRPGMAARIELGRGVAPLAARVRLVEPAAFTKVSALGVEEQRVNVVLDFAEPLDRVQAIGDAFRVDAHIVTQRLDDALKVPVGALFRDGAGWAVFVAEGTRASKRPVEVAMRNGVEAVVTSGIAAGDTVVVYPSDKLAHGVRIESRSGN
jgi:HlyD family secretion protein